MNQTTQNELSNAALRQMPLDDLLLHCQPRDLREEMLHQRASECSDELESAQVELEENLEELREANDELIDARIERKEAEDTLKEAQKELEGTKGELRETLIDLAKTQGELEDAGKLVEVLG